MSGHSILYLGRGEFAADYLSELETLGCCTYLSRSNVLELPEDASYCVDLVLLEIGPLIAQSGRTLPELIQSLDPYPVVALTGAQQLHLSGTTLSFKELKALLLERPREDPLVPCEESAHWVEPGLYVKVRYLERTGHGTLRGPVFLELITEDDT